MDNHDENNELTLIARSGDNLKKIVLAIDIMGGDFGPKTTLEGVALASETYPNVKFVLFGDKKSENQLKRIVNLKNYEFIIPLKCPFN